MCFAVRHDSKQVNSDGNDDIVSFDTIKEEKEEEEEEKIHIDGILRAAADFYPLIGQDRNNGAVLSMVMENFYAETLDELIEIFKTWDPNFPMYSHTNDDIGDEIDGGCGCSSISRG